MNLSQSIKDTISVTKSLRKLVRTETPDQIRLRYENLLNQLALVRIGIEEAEKRERELMAEIERLKR